VDSAHGYIVVAGIVVDGDGNNEVAIARYNEADGSLDTSFGSSGIVTTNLSDGWDGTGAVARRERRQHPGGRRTIRSVLPCCTTPATARGTRASAACPMGLCIPAWAAAT